MKIITLATQKGGSGKTTLATNLAVAAAKNGCLTLIIDTDSQQTALDWFSKRDNQENPIVLVAENKEKLDSLLTLAKNKGIERVFIDTQGANTDLVNFSILKSDFCLIPCRSSGFDVTAQRATAANLLDLKKQGAFIITQTTARGKETQETKNILLGLGVQIAEQQTTLLKAYKDAAILSESVIEIEENGKAAQEITAIFKWLEKKLKDNPLLNELRKG